MYEERKSHFDKEDRKLDDSMSGEEDDEPNSSAASFFSNNSTTTHTYNSTCESWSNFGARVRFEAHDSLSASRQ